MTDGCIQERDLKAFSLGRLDERRCEEIVAHLAVCSKCEETIAGIDNTADSLLEAVRVATGAQDRESGAQSDAEILQDLANPWGESSAKPEIGSSGEWVRDYELIEQLGRGGMGTVYRAVHARLERVVAIKLLPARRLKDAVAVARFEREMKAIGRLDHPAIVRATDAGESDGTHFLVMDFVDGIDLSWIVRLIGPLDVASACEVIRQAALGLQYAHEQGLIHRDVKPGNLMVEISDAPDRKAEVKILDLGLALFGAASEAVDELTTVGQLMGTLDYMAPEQADNSHDVGTTADVYSLGATLFKLLTGTAPYETEGRRTPLQKMKALATIDAPPVISRRPDLPDGVAALVDRMLLRDPADRYQTAAEVARAVTPLCQGHQLAGLTQRAMELRAKRTESIGPLAVPFQTALADVSPEQVAAATRRASVTDTRRESDLASEVPVPGTRMHGRSSFRVRAAMITLGCLLFAAAGIIFRVNTDNGTLIIECSFDGIPVEIRQGTRKVEGLTLSAGQNRVVLHSGEYEIVIPAEFDNLTVDSKNIELRRGDTRVARITQLTDVAENPADPEAVALAGGPLALGQKTPHDRGGVSSDAQPSTDQPVYQGKSFDEWVQRARVERSGEELSHIVQAIGVLGRNSRDVEATRVILEIIDRTPRKEIDTSKTKLGDAIYLALMELNASSVVTTIADEFASLNPSVRTYFTMQLSGGEFAGRLVENEQFVMQLVKFLEDRFDQLPLSGNDADSESESFPAADRVSRGEQATIFRMIFAHAGTGRPGGKMEQFLRRVVAAAGRPPSNNRMFWPAAGAAIILSQHGTDPAFTRIMSDAVRNEISVNRRRFSQHSLVTRPGVPQPAEEIFQANSALWIGVAGLGRQAEPVLPAVYELLSREDSPLGFGLADARLRVPRSGASWGPDLPSVTGRDVGRYVDEPIPAALLAVEVIAASRTRDPRALELLRAEFRRLTSTSFPDRTGGQEPSDGPFELVPGRGFLLLTGHPRRSEATRIEDQLEPAFSRGSLNTNPEVELMNSLSLAWRALTGAFPRFAARPLGRFVFNSEIPDRDATPAWPRVIDIRENPSVEEPSPTPSPTE